MEATPTVVSQPPSAPERAEKNLEQIQTDGQGSSSNTEMEAKPAVVDDVNRREEAGMAGNFNVPSAAPVELQAIQVQATEDSGQDPDGGGITAAYTRSLSAMAPAGNIGWPDVP